MTEKTSQNSDNTHIAQRLSCGHVSHLEPYMSARRIGGSGDLWINANELPYQVPQYPLDDSDYHRYPDHSPVSLVSAYAEFVGLPSDWVLPTRGADESIELLVRAFCYSGRDAIVDCPPTYGLYQISAEIHDVAIYNAPLTEDYELDLAAIYQAPENTKIVFLCNPNNPTGNVFKRETIIEVIEHFADKALVVVDEAYIEFCPEQSLVSELVKYDHLVVIRTMSKAFGLAGVHVGYTLTNPHILSVINRVIQPYPIAEPCAQIAIQALADKGVAVMQENVDKIITSRQRFCEKLQGINNVEQVYPSETNFVLVKFKDQAVAWQQLVDHGIVARVPAINETIRFSMGNDEQMERVIAALKSA